MLCSTGYSALFAVGFGDKDLALALGASTTTKGLAYRLVAQLIMRNPRCPTCVAPVHRKLPIPLVLEHETELRGGRPPGTTQSKEYHRICDQNRRAILIAVHYFLPTIGRCLLFELSPRRVKQPHLRTRGAENIQNGLRFMHQASLRALRKARCGTSGLPYRSCFPEKVSDAAAWGNRLGWPISH